MDGDEPKNPPMCTQGRRSTAGLIVRRDDMDLGSEAKKEIPVIVKGSTAAE
jgi:hypothetical protein